MDKKNSVSKINKKIRSPKFKLINNFKRNYRQKWWKNRTWAGILFNLDICSFFKCMPYLAAAGIKLQVLRK